MQRDVLEAQQSLDTQRLRVKAVHSGLNDLRARQTQQARQPHTHTSHTHTHTHIHTHTHTHVTPLCRLLPAGPRVAHGRRASLVPGPVAASVLPVSSSLCPWSAPSRSVCSPGRGCMCARAGRVPGHSRRLKARRLLRRAGHAPARASRYGSYETASVCV